MYVKSFINRYKYLFISSILLICCLSGLYFISSANASEIINNDYSNSQLDTNKLNQYSVDVKTAKAVKNYKDSMNVKVTFYYDTHPYSYYYKQYEQECYMIDDGKTKPGDWTGINFNYIIDSSYKDYHPPTLESYFSLAKSISGLKNLNTDKAKSMKSTFSSADVTSLDLSDFNTSNVTDMSNMFYSCGNLASLNLSNFNTSNVTNMSGMFSKCYKLQSLNISSFNTNKVTKMESMFLSCKLLKSINVSSFNTSNVVNMRQMFDTCSNLTSIDVSKFNTSKVTDMCQMFARCASVKTLNVSNFTVSQVKYAYGSISEMFRECSSLETLTLGNFNTDADVSNIFYSCKNLKTIYTSKDTDWTDKSWVKGANVFKDCINLVGGNHTSYNPNYANCDYARVDGGVKKPGYFTIIPAKQYTATVDLQGGTVSKIPSGWAKSGDLYTKKFQENTNFSTILNEWKNVTISKNNAVFNGWSPSSGSLTKNTTFKVTWVVPGTLFRLYNPNSGEHFYTSSTGERDYLANVGWKYEGIAWVSPVKSNTPVYRLYNPNSGDHHYTTSGGERNQLISVGWSNEGIGWYSDDAKKVPVYRQYNPNAFCGSHNFTISKSENDWLVQLGWRAEGIAWYAVG